MIFIKANAVFRRTDVQSNVISIAWNHLLKGIENTSDGSHVGLHEMSHALYIQKMVIEEKYARRFASRYKKVLHECRIAHEYEVNKLVDLYSDYATKDLQEFWAETVEIFFEKPEELNKCYPDIYRCTSALLQQNPLIKENPLSAGSF